MLRGSGLPKSERGYSADIILNHYECGRNRPPKLSNSVK